jgi:DNA-binding NarL/FixJ family response regulator
MKGAESRYALPSLRWSRNPKLKSASASVACEMALVSGTPIARNTLGMEFGAVSMTIRLLIIDDHDLVRAGLVQYLGMYPDIEVVGGFANGDELLEKLHATLVDMLLLDLVMPGLCGTELIRRVRRTYPDLLILMLSMHNEMHVVLRSLKAGASVYICKDCKPEILLEAIRKVSTTGKYLSPVMAEQIAFFSSPFSSDPIRQDPDEIILSDRERQIFHLIVDGKKIKEIANELTISDKTVSTHKYNLLTKLGLKSDVDLVRYAIQEKL